MAVHAGDEFARFYTRSAIGRLLIETMAENSPRSLLDLGAGAGVLSHAALERWRDAEYVTVDIDANAYGMLRSQFQVTHASMHVHHVHDVLDVDLPDRILEGRSFDASVSNPPYLHPTWRPEFEEILGKAGLSDTIASRSEVGADILFLAQSIRATACGGTVGLILPDGIITGKQYGGLRKRLFEQHTLGTVIQLPRGSFHGTEAQAFILAFRNHVAGNRRVALQRLTATGELTDKLFVDLEAAEHRLDYQYHAEDWGTDHGTTLKDLGASVTRGTINATVARHAGVPIFHTTDFPKTGDGRVALPNRSSSRGNRVEAHRGDILLARIDRLLHTKIVLVTEGAIPISDCVYRIRCTPAIAPLLVDAMRGEDGQRLISAASRGIGARLLSKSELLNIPFDLRSTVKPPREKL